MIMLDSKFEAQNFGFHDAILWHDSDSPDPDSSFSFRMA
jgi:hypothetical protein